MLTPPGRMPNDLAMSRLGKLLPWLDQHPAMRALVVHVGRIERVTLVSIILAATVLLAFAKLADAVGEGGTRAFDERILLALRTPGNLADPIGPRWFEEMMRDFTALGGTGVLALMALAVGGFLAMTRKGHAALLVLVAVVGGVLVSQTMKWAYARPRPELVPHGAEIYTASFPSGHSMMSAIVYLTLGALLARTQSDAEREGLHPGDRGVPHTARRHQPGVSRRALANRRAGRLGTGRSLGTGLLDGDGLAAGARPGRTRDTVSPSRRPVIPAKRQRMQEASHGFPP